MHAELDLRKGYLENEELSSIYFGGGTPSLLDPKQISSFTDHISTLFNVAADAEITLEANPDDLSPIYVQDLKRHTQVNRFSIGIQSFYEEDLKWMNRAHTSAQALESIHAVQDAGYSNITIDLIYGYPLLTDEKWVASIERTLDLNIPHISAYSMTVEGKTALGHFIRAGKQLPMNDAQSASQFVLLMDKLKLAGYVHYEVSNFALPGHYSVHNSNYWRGVPYLGIGPSAHSYNLRSRQWTVSNNHKYMEGISSGILQADEEVLTVHDRFNEYVMTSLRTVWGLDLDFVNTSFGTRFKELTEQSLTSFLCKGWLVKGGNIVSLTREGMLFADHIASELFLTSDTI